MARKGPDLRHLARDGAEIAVKVTPRAASDRLDETPEGLRIAVTAAPEDGRANEAVRKLLSRALGVPKTALVLTRGQTARQKVFRIAL